MDQSVVPCLVLTVPSWPSYRFIRSKHVDGDFNCSDNCLTSLENAPEYVGGDFKCSGNNISDITNLPTKYIGGDFYAYGAGNTFEITDELRKIVKGDIYK